MISKLKITQRAFLTAKGFLLIALLGICSTQAQTVDQGEGEYLVTFADQFDAAGASVLFDSLGTPLHQRQSTVIRESMSKSSKACNLLRVWLDEYNRENQTEWSLLDSFWIVNAVILRMDWVASAHLSQTLEIRSIDPVNALPIGFTES
ncbi:MAG: hypothetical protein FJ336_03555, partial [Sphingomonadales bacterium]|nr:hypothetical protein [Sphingomonadales bacterium]